MRITETLADYIRTVAAERGAESHASIKAALMDTLHFDKAAFEKTCDYLAASFLDVFVPQSATDSAPVDDYGQPTGPRTAAASSGLTFALKSSGHRRPRKPQEAKPAVDKSHAYTIATLKWAMEQTKGYLKAHGGACARLAKAIPGKSTNVAKDKLTLEQAEAIWNAKGDFKMEVPTTRRKRDIGPGAVVVHS